MTQQKKQQQEQVQQEPELELTPEQKARIAEEYKRQQAMNSPMGKGDEVYNPEKNKFGMSGKQFIQQVFISIIVALGIVFILANPTKLVNATSVNASFTGMDKKIAENKTAIDLQYNTLAGQLNSSQSKQDGLITQLQTNANTLTSAYGTLATKESITNIANTATNAAKNANDAVVKVSGYDTTIKQLNNDLDTLKKTVDSQSSTISSQATSIKDLQAKNTTLQIQVTAIQKKQDESNSTTTTSSSIGTTSTYKQLTASIIANWLTNSSYVATSSISTTGTSLPFSFTLNNTSGKPISSIQLAMGFYVMDSTGNSLNLPSGVTTALTTVGLTPQWIVQTSGVGNVLLFATSTNNSIFQLFNFTQDTGSVSYNVNLTLTAPSSGGNISGMYTIYPVIKVVGYTQ